MRLDYRIIRSNRKTIALQIKPDGHLEVRCPRKMTEDAVRRFVESKASWIEKHLSQLPPQTEPKFTPAEIQQIAGRILNSRLAFAIRGNIRKTPTYEQINKWLNGDEPKTKANVIPLPQPSPIR